MFTTHPHGDHFDPVILSWGESSEDIHYFFGWELEGASEHHLLAGPRATAHVSGVNIYTINSHHSGVPEVAYLVEVDGHWIYHNGDYLQDYLADFPYLGTLTDKLDLVFHAGVLDESAQITHQGRFLMEHFEPGVFFPMHYGDNELRGEAFSRAMAERGYDTTVPVPRMRGDHWSFGG